MRCAGRGCRSLAVCTALGSYMRCMSWRGCTAARPLGGLTLVGGRQSEVDELRAQAARLDIPPRKLITPGPVSQEKVAIYLNAADVLVIPDTVTQLTASPLKLFEYMAVSKPIVLKDMPALREILNGDAAEYFREGDAISLASALERLISNPERAAQIAANALARSS